MKCVNMFVRLGPFMTLMLVLRLMPHACVKSESLSHEIHVLRLSPSCEHVCHVTFMVPRYERYFKFFEHTSDCRNVCAFPSRRTCRSPPHDMSCHAVSCHGRVMSCHAMSCHMKTGNHVMPCHVTCKKETMSCRAMSCHVMPRENRKPCHVWPCRVT